MSTVIIPSASTEETIRIGERLGARLAGASGGEVLLLVGPLGAGKTVLAKGIARGLGVAEPVVSPTYTIVSQYPAGSRTLYHVDLYRIEGQDQLENLGLDDILRGEDIVVVEWGEKLEPMMDGPYTRITIELLSDGSREIHSAELSGGRERTS